MDLRYEFEEILRQYGHNCLLVREDKKIRCSCWNEKTQESDRECPVCFGLGWNPIIEKHTVRNSDTSVPETLAMLGEDGSFGGLAVPGRFYYMKHDVNVAQGSLIVQVGWAGNKPVYQGGGIYEVSHIDDFHFENGEVTYKKVYVKDQPIEKEIRGIRISHSSGILNYELIRG